MTLVEALIGTALLGTLLAATLIARSRLSVQARRAAMRTEAVTVLDALLADWWPARQKLPRNASGEVVDRPGWRWRTRTVASEQAEALGGQVVAVEVFGPDAEPNGPPAASVDILLTGKAEEDAP